MKTREEIAKELKYISRDCLGSDGLLPTLKRVLSVEDGSWRTVLSTLADLIDPICETEILSTGNIADYECREHFSHCLSCGCTYGYVLYGEDGDVSMDELPQYCPCCGARVVRCDE